GMADPISMYSWSRNQSLLPEALVRSIFSFPNPVNEVAARLVAGGVVLMSLATIVFDQPWLTAAIAYGFVARVLTGPTLSPLARLARAGVIPETVCAQCNDLSLRRSMLQADVT